MADPVSPSVDLRSPSQDAAAPDLDEMGSRGRLIIKERAASRIAVTTALGVPGVTRHISGLGRITGRELPRATVTLTAHAISVDLGVAVTWPNPIAHIAQETKAAVASVLHSLTGLPVTRVDITVAAIVTQDVESPSGTRAVPAAGRPDGS